MLFRPGEDGPGLERAMGELCARASDAVAAGYTILILSDRGVNEEFAPVPSLLATAGVHHHLVREGTRTKCALVIETGDAREVHHMALLIGYGAGAVNPYLAFESLDDMIRQGALQGVTHERAVLNYIRALNKGILKVMSKMGISTVQSYCGAQIFEAIGLAQEFVDRCFTWTASRIGGVGIDVIAEETARAGTRTRFRSGASGRRWIRVGDAQWRRDGGTCSRRDRLQAAARDALGPVRIYEEYRLVDDQSRRLGTLRGLMDRPAGPPVPIEEVEPAGHFKRFATGAVSCGSISQEAHECWRSR